jgi:hypothetical protein
VFLSGKQYTATLSAILDDIPTVANHTHITIEEYHTVAAAFLVVHPSTEEHTKGCFTVCQSKSRFVSYWIGRVEAIR